jgi:hypothetical protein
MNKLAPIARTSNRKLPANQFNIVIPVKPYVKRFIELNYGDPVYFHPDKDDYEKLRSCLKDSRKADSRFPPRTCTYSCEITVLLSERDFYRYGWEMSHVNIIKFNAIFEARAKYLMRSMVGIYHGLGLPVNVSITKFQDRFYFDENVWPYDSIRKDFYRNGNNYKVDFDNEIYLKIEKIVLTNLSGCGTITPSFISDYENDR